MNQLNPDIKHVRVAEAVEITGFSKKKIIQMIHAGELRVPPKGKKNSPYMIPRAELVRVFKVAA